MPPSLLQGSTCRTVVLRHPFFLELWSPALGVRGGEGGSLLGAGGEAAWRDDGQVKHHDHPGPRRELGPDPSSQGDVSDVYSSAAEVAASNSHTLHRVPASG